VFALMLQCETKRMLLCERDVEWVYAAARSVQEEQNRSR